MAASDYFTAAPHKIEEGITARGAQINQVSQALETAFGKLPAPTEIKLGTIQYAIDTGAANAYVATLPYAPDAYVAGMTIDMLVTNTNSGASTININALGAASLKRPDGTALQANDLLTGAVATLKCVSVSPIIFHLAGLSTASLAAAAAAADSAAAAAADLVDTGQNVVLAQTARTGAEAAETGANAALASIESLAGNVSRYVMSTATATAGYYSNIATLSYPATNNVAANMTLLLTPKTASGVYRPIILTVTALQATAGLSASSKISMLSNDGTALAYNDIFLDTATAANGTDVKLWIQSIIAAKYDVQVLAEAFDTGISATYHDAVAWQSATPTGAVDITSDWAGSGQLSSTSLQNGWAGTVYYEKSDDGHVYLFIYLTAAGTTTDGTVLFTLPARYRPTITYQPMVLSGPGATGGVLGRVVVDVNGNLLLSSYVAGGSLWRAAISYRARN